MEEKIYEFKDYLLDITEQRFQKNGKDISLPPKVFEVLTVLIKNHNQLVSYDDLMEKVWHNTYVEETNLRYCIHFLRKTFDEDFIETISKRGYRFNAEVRSFTTEEFIKRHTGNFKLKNLIDREGLNADPEDFVESDTKKTLTKTIGFLAVGLLVFGVGVLSYYLWPNSNDPKNKELTTITVLPFSIIGQGSNDQAGIQKGLMEILVFDLSKIKGLKITPLIKLEKFKGNKVEPLTVGRELSSDLVLDGSYRFEGDQFVKVNARLFDIKSGETLFAESINVKAESSIKKEKIISLQISRKIFNRLAELKDLEFLKGQNISEESKKNYLIGQQILRNNERNRWKEGVEKFSQILKNEPGWEPSYGKYSEAVLRLHGGGPKKEILKEIIDKASKLGFENSGIYVARGWYLILNYQWDEAEQAFKKAIKFDPQNAFAFEEYAYLLNSRRKFEEAERTFHKALELTPFNPFLFTGLCRNYLNDEQFENAFVACNKALEIDENFGFALKMIEWIYLESEDYKGYFEKYFSDLTPKEINRDPLAKALKEGNVKLFWQERINKRFRNKRKNDSPFAIAGYYAKLGDKEKTLEYLEKIRESKNNIDFIMQANADAGFKFVRNEPRFRKLFADFNLQP